MAMADQNLHIAGVTSCGSDKGPDTNSGKLIIGKEELPKHVQEKNNLNTSHLSYHTGYLRSPKGYMRDIHNFLDKKYQNDPKKSSSTTVIEFLLDTEDAFIRYKNEYMAKGKSRSAIVRQISQARINHLGKVERNSVNQTTQPSKPNTTTRTSKGGEKAKKSTTEMFFETTSESKESLNEIGESDAENTDCSTRNISVAMQDIQKFLDEKHPNDPKDSVFCKLIKSLMKTEHIFIKYKNEKMNLGRSEKTIIKAIHSARLMHLARTKSVDKVSMKKGLTTKKSSATRKEDESKGSKDKEKCVSLPVDVTPVQSTRDRVLQAARWKDEN